METEQIINWLRDKAVRAEHPSWTRMMTMAAKRLEELDGATNNNVNNKWQNGNTRKKSYIRICPHCGGQAYFCGIGCSYKFCPNCGKSVKPMEVE